MSSLGGHTNFQYNNRAMIKQMGMTGGFSNLNQYQK